MGYAYRYDIAYCPECDEDLRLEDAVRLFVVIRRIEEECLTRLSAEGELVDVDDLVFCGCHSRTECARCGCDFLDYEEGFEI